MNTAGHARSACQGRACRSAYFSVAVARKRSSIPSRLSASGVASATTSIRRPEVRYAADRREPANLQSAAFTQPSALRWDVQGPDELGQLFAEELFRAEGLGLQVAVDLKRHQAVQVAPDAHGESHGGRG